MKMVKFTMYMKFFACFGSLGRVGRVQIRTAIRRVSTRSWSHLRLAVDYIYSLDSFKRRKLPPIERGKAEDDTFGPSWMYVQYKLVE